MTRFVRQIQSIVEALMITLAAPSNARSDDSSAASSSHIEETHAGRMRSRPLSPSNEPAANTGNSTFGAVPSDDAPTQSGSQSGGFGYRHDTRAAIRSPGDESSDITGSASGIGGTLGEGSGSTSSSHP